MAKVGEGDPRWIVSNREDGRNVGNWHWEEKNLMPWTERKLKELFSEAVVFDGPQCSIRTTAVDKIKGECVANNRKGKTIFFYEFNFEVGWVANSTNNGESFVTKGKFELPNISEENSATEHEIKSSCSDKGEPHDFIYQIVRKEGVRGIQQLLVRFFESMVEEFSIRGEYKPRPIENIEAEKAQAIQKAAAPAPKPVAAPQKVADSSTIEFTEKFRCPPREVYECLIDPGRLLALTQGSAKMEPKVGGQFQLFSNISGENLELVPGQKIVQKWRFSDWPEGHFSTVTMELDESNGARLKFKQVGVPPKDVARTEAGWKSNIFQRIRAMFGL